MTRDHGGGLDAAIAAYGGVRSDWTDLSTGINPVPYPVGHIPMQSWTELPDRAATKGLLAAARTFWAVPGNAQIIAASGASSLIARLPVLAPPGPVHIPGPTYNEHAAAFAAAGHSVTDSGDTPLAAPVRVLVHPNNPDGRLWTTAALTGRTLTVVDESFCDVDPAASLVAEADRGDVLILKSFGKFWGLAGLRLGFAIGPAALIDRLADVVGPWAVSGPALTVGMAALSDPGWAAATRARLLQDAARLDAIMVGRGATVVGGTTLFRLYDVDDAARWQERLARHHVWSRIFPYSRRWLRLGLPGPDRWTRIEDAA
jgi:cobalamin biosynthetic protein CobC